MFWRLECSQSAETVAMILDFSGPSRHTVEAIHAEGALELLPMACAHRGRKWMKLETSTVSITLSRPVDSTTTAPTGELIILAVQSRLSLQSNTVEACLCVLLMLNWVLLGDGRRVDGCRPNNLIGLHPTSAQPASSVSVSPPTSELFDDPSPSSSSQHHHHLPQAPVQLITLGAQ